jgi:hypothetical protein
VYANNSIDGTTAGAGSLNSFCYYSSSRRWSININTNRS